MVNILASTACLLLATVAFATPLQPDASINKFIGDLRGLSRGVSRLASAVNSIGKKFTPSEALAVRNAAVEVGEDLSKANNEVKGIHHVPYEDAKVVIEVTAGFTPDLVEALKRFGEKKRVVLTRFSAPEVEEALKGLRAGAGELTNAIVGLEPSSFKGEAKKIRSEINEAIEKAIRIYS